MKAGALRVLGLSVSLSEAEVQRRAFLDGLKTRGLRGVKFIASDDHLGLKVARPTNLSFSDWSAMFVERILHYLFSRA